MNDKKVVAIGKIGRSIKFKGNDISTGSGADVTWFSLISRMNPEWDFYFVGPNELYKLTKEEYEYIFPYKNVYSSFDNKAEIHEAYRTNVEYFEKNNIKVDFGLFFLGLHFDKSIDGFLMKEDGVHQYNMLNASRRYAGPYIYFLNETNIPWYSMSEDARYITLHTKDILNYERLTFSQINGVFKSHKHIPDREHNVINNKTMKWAYHDVKAIYSAIERIALNSLSPTWREDIPMDRKLNGTGAHCNIFSNGCGTSKINVSGNNSERYPMYKEWVLDNFRGTEYEDTMIYGNWDQEIYDQEPRIKNVKMLDMPDTVADTRYTLVYSQIRGFVTIKPWEMICLGIVPFMHPDYDPDRLLGLPEYLYLSDKQDLVNKMRELDADPAKHRQLLEDCFACITPEFTDGSYINNFIFGTIAEDLGFTYEKKVGVPSVFNRFDKKMFSVDAKKTDKKKC